MEAKKGESKKARIPQRKRRRPVNQDEDSSSDESEIPKPKFTFNDIDVIDTKQSSSASIKDTQLLYDVPLDLSSPTLKQEIKVEGGNGSSTQVT